MPICAALGNGEYNRYGLILESTVYAHGLIQIVLSKSSFFSRKTNWWADLQTGCDARKISLGMSGELSKCPEKETCSKS